MSKGNFLINALDSLFIVIITDFTILFILTGLRFSPPREKLLFQSLFILQKTSLCKIEFIFQRTTAQLRNCVVKNVFDTLDARNNHLRTSIFKSVGLLSYALLFSLLYCLGYWIYYIVKLVVVNCCEI